MLKEAISTKDSNIVKYIDGLESTEKITKKQQKTLIPLAQKSNDVNIINYINNYNFLHPKPKEEEAPYVKIPEPFNLEDFTNLNSLGDKEPLIVDNEKTETKNNLTDKINNFFNYKPTNGAKYQQKRRDSDSQEL